MRDTDPNTEPRELPELPAPSPDDLPDDSAEETLHVSSLRPAPTRFSQRRLLNIASIVVAGVLLLALAIHWLPDVLPGLDNAQPTATSSFSFSPRPTSTPSVRGSGWKPIGPDWAQDIVFTSNGALGYACGALGPGAAPILVALYDAHQNVWLAPTNPATGSDCRISVSPVNPSNIMLVADQCSNCADNASSIPTSQVFRSFNGGETWAPLILPPSTLVGSVVWANNETLYLVAEHTQGASETSPPTYSLLISRANGPLTEISARQLVGHDTTFGPVLLVSSGVTVYASLNPLFCASVCTTQVRSGDDGRSWTRFVASYQGRPINLAAAQDTNTLIGWTLNSDEQPGLMVVLRSDDDGDHWQELPMLPENPSISGAQFFILPDRTVYAFSFGPSTLVYTLHDGANRWQTVAPMPTGAPITVQHDARGHAVALWGRAIKPTSAAGLEYYPLHGAGG